MEDSSSSANIPLSIAYALILSVGSVIAGYITAKVAYRKAFQRFVAIVIGGMFVRLLGVSVIIWITLATGSLHTLAYALSFVVSYFVFMLAEIFYINHRHNAMSLKKRVQLK